MSQTHLGRFGALLVASAMAMVLPAVALASCADPEQDTVAAPETRTLDVEDLSFIEDIVDEVEREYGGTVSIAVPGLEVGFPTATAWSTIKVPIAIAALRIDPNDEYINELVRATITWSDNDAAIELWRMLGADAGDATEAVLRETGDPTIVEFDGVHPEESFFGDTEWSLENQVMFADGLACLDEAEVVLNHMTDIEEDQRWGLGRVPGTAFKGGWGPDEETGDYLARQFGLLGGDRPVSIVVTPESGSFEDAQVMADAAVMLLNEHLDDLPVATCPSI